MLDASARVAEVAGSGIVDVHVCVESFSTMHGLQVASILLEHCRRPHGYGNAFQAAVPTQHIGYNAFDSDVSSVTPPPMDMLAVQPMEVLAVQSAALGSATRLLLANGRDGAAAPPHE